MKLYENSKLCLACKYSHMFKDDDRVYCRNLDLINSTYPYAISDDSACSELKKK